VKDDPLVKKLCDVEHLLETMEMVQRACEELLVDTMVPTRYHVVVILAIPGFFLVQSADQKQINCMQEVLSQGAFLRWLNDFWIDGLRKVLVDHLFLIGLVAAKEYIAELSKACHIVQVQFFRHADELRDHLIESKLDFNLAIILVDFSLTLVTQIVALKLVTLGEHCLSVPPALKNEKGLLFVDTSHCFRCL
jgi:hypothetical protein